jgi:hypothetical protein
VLVGKTDAADQNAKELNVSPYTGFDGQSRTAVSHLLGLSGRGPSIGYVSIEYSHVAAAGLEQSHHLKQRALLQTCAEEHVAPLEAALIPATFESSARQLQPETFAGARSAVRLHSMGIYCLNAKMISAHGDLCERVLQSGTAAACMHVRTSETCMHARTSAGWTEPEISRDNGIHVLLL